MVPEAALVKEMVGFSAKKTTPEGGQAVTRLISSPTLGNG
jgi:hypothetical protein